MDKHVGKKKNREKESRLAVHGTVKHRIIMRIAVPLLGVSP